MTEMKEFRDEDFSGALVRKVDFSRADFRAVTFHGTRMRGVELVDVSISGEIRNVVINGVDVAPLIDAELNRRMPQRAKMSPDTADGFREAWEILENLWTGTVARAGKLPEAKLHESVDGEWSFIQTLRHLGFATACWVERMILGDPAPWHPLDLPWDEARGWEGFSWDRDARPSLDEVLKLRRTRQATVRKVMAELTDEQLATHVGCTAPGWPRLEDFPFKECLIIILIEEWEHRLYAERDLSIVEASS